MIAVSLGRKREVVTHCSQISTALHRDGGTAAFFKETFTTE